MTEEYGYERGYFFKCLRYGGVYLLTASDIEGHRESGDYVDRKAAELGIPRLPEAQIEPLPVSLAMEASIPIEGALLESSKPNQRTERGTE